MNDLVPDRYAHDAERRFDADVLIGVRLAAGPRSAACVLTIVAGLVAPRARDSRSAQDASSGRRSLSNEQWFDEVPDRGAPAQRPSTGPAPASALPAGYPSARHDRAGSRPRTAPACRHRAGTLAAIFGATAGRPEVLPAALHAPMSCYEAQVGTIIQLVLLASVNGDLLGQVIAQVRETSAESSGAR
jgi:type IV secretory pathway VirB10-like protein